MKLIVDDDIHACERLKQLLLQCGVPEEEIETETDPLCALNKLSRTRYEIVFLDVDMPQMTGTELLNTIRKNGYEDCVIFTTAYDSYAIEALRGKALDYLLKPVASDELQAALRRFEQHEAKALKNFDKLLDYGITRRQLQIAKRIFEGKNSHEIAEDLFLSKHTVDTHRRTILRKTGCKNTTELFRLL